MNVQVKTNTKDYTSEERKAIVEESTKSSSKDVSQKYNISSPTMSKWRREAGVATARASAKKAARSNNTVSISRSALERMLTDTLTVKYAPVLDDKVDIKNVQSALLKFPIPEEYVDFSDQLEGTILHICQQHIGECRLLKAEIVDSTIEVMYVKSLPEIEISLD